MALVDDADIGGSYGVQPVDKRLDAGDLHRQHEIRRLATLDHAMRRARLRECLGYLVKNLRPMRQNRYGLALLAGPVRYV